MKRDAGGIGRIDQIDANIVGWLSAAILSIVPTKAAAGKHVPLIGQLPVNGR